MSEFMLLEIKEMSLKLDRAYWSKDLGEVKKVIREASEHLNNICDDMNINLEEEFYE